VVWQKLMFDSEVEEERKKEGRSKINAREFREDTGHLSREGPRKHSSHQVCIRIFLSAQAA